MMKTISHLNNLKDVSIYSIETSTDFITFLYKNKCRFPEIYIRKNKINMLWTTNNYTLCVNIGDNILNLYLENIHHGRITTKDYNLENLSMFYDDFLNIYRSNL